MYYLLVKLFYICSGVSSVVRKVCLCGVCICLLCVFDYLCVHVFSCCHAVSCLPLLPLITVHYVVLGEVKDVRFL